MGKAPEAFGSRAGARYSIGAPIDLDRVYYFDPQSRITRDISELDPAASEIAEAGWGGLTELSGKLADVVADAVAGDRGT